MKKITSLILILIGFFLFVLTSCGNPGELSAEATVEDFIQALYSRDPGQLQEHAPFFAELGVEAKEELFDSVQDFSNWEIKSVRVEGKKAEVLVQFYSADKNLRIQFPLRAEGGKWKIQNRISTSTTIDFIPAETSKSES